MTAADLRRLFEDGFSDYEFSYKGKMGSVCPHMKENLIAAMYDGKYFDFETFDELMSAPFVGEKSFNEIAQEVIMYG